MKDTSRQRLRRLRALCLLCATLLLGAALTACGTSSSLSVKAAHSFHLMFTPEDEEVVILKDGAPMGDPLNAEASAIGTALNGNAAYVLADDILYAVTAKNIVEVAFDVISADISAEGSTIAYLNDHDELLLYHIKDDRSVEVCDDYTGNGFRLSPDGEAIAYADDKSTVYVYRYRDEESTRIVRNANPIALSDNADILYYLDVKDGRYCAYANEKTIKLGNQEETYLLFNADRSEVAVRQDDSLYIIKDGGEKQRISSSFSTMGATAHDGFPTAKTLSLKSFVGQLFLEEDGTLCRITEELTSEKVAEKVEDFALSPDGKVCYYTVRTEDEEVDSDSWSDEWNDAFAPLLSLYRIQVSDKGGEEEATAEKLAEERIDQMIVTNDGSACYFIDHEKVLYYTDGVGFAEELADHVARASLTHDDYLLFLYDLPQYNFLQEGGTLAYTFEGAEPEDIDDGITTIWTDEHATFYTADPEQVDSHLLCTLYVSTKGAEFEKLGKDVSLIP